MDKLEKAKRITMRDFLLEVMIVGYIPSDNLINALLLDKAKRCHYVFYNPIRVTPMGLSVINEWKDLK